MPSPPFCPRALMIVAATFALAPLALLGLWVLAIGVFWITVEGLAVAARIVAAGSSLAAGLRGDFLAGVVVGLAYLLGAAATILIWLAPYAVGWLGFLAFRPGRGRGKAR